MHLKRILVIFTLALILLGHGTSSAREIRQGDQCVIGATETIQGNLFALCRTLIVNGKIEGNLIAAATRSEINGSIVGDVYLLSGQLDLNGSVTGDLHFGGAVLRILPTAKFDGESSDLISLALSTTLADAVTIPGSVTSVGYQLVLDGSVGKEINFWGSALTVNGSAGGNIDATVGDPQSGISQLQTLLIPFSWDVNLINPGLIVGKQGDIQGDLHYSGPTSGTIDGSVKGETNFTAVITQPDLTQIITEEEGGRRGLTIYLSQALKEFITLAIVGVIGLWVFSRPLQSQIKHIQSRPLPSMGVGLLTFIVAFPIVLIIVVFIIFIIFILLLLQLDGLLLTLVSGGLLGTLVGAISIFFFIAIFVSRIIVCLWAGRVLVRLSLGDDNSPRITYLSLIVGVALLALLSPLPVIGWIINALALFLGLGAVMIGAQSQFRVYRDVGPAVPLRVMPPLLPRRPEAVRPFPPPMIDDHSHSVGTENLPEGFTWWDD
ncbi:MAG: polymer-forming cytoskeletal protein [Chloroflexota bacterium]